MTLEDMSSGRLPSLTIAAILAVALAGCGTHAATANDPSELAAKEPTSATSAGCEAMEQSTNNVNGAIFDWYQQHDDGGGPALQEQFFRTVYGSFNTDVSKATDLARGSSLSAKFEELRRFAGYYGDGKPVNSAVSISTSSIIDEVIGACESAGVDMQIMDIRTGRYR